jgi:filamentous hemagglutinin family protein
MFTYRSSTKVSLGLGLIFALTHPAFSQITPNGTRTLAIPQGNQIDITGGTQAGANLFHSFQDFNLNSAQIANFLSNPQTQNILARINGGNPSFINGLLQVTGGNSNLFLINPAGIVFGANASLNIPASFTATTANQIGFGNSQYFSATGHNNYAVLTGNPNSFLFTTNQAGSIVNAGNLAVGYGQNLSLIAGNTLNTGRLTAPGGEIQLLAVPGTNRVRLSQPGQVLSLEFVPPDSNEFRALDLPALLTGSDLPRVEVNPSGQVQVAGTSLPTQQGVAAASGRIDVSSTMGNGGTVQVMGNRVAVLNSRINANGATGGGVVRLGGEYLGGINTGIAPAFRFNSQRTLVDRDSLIRANATVTGEGGRVIVWADQSTGYFGRITGRGATGRGGFVEVSGRENLTFDGRVELQGLNGLGGSLLLDPENIIISATTTDNTQITDATILSGESPGATWYISAGALAAIPAATSIDIAANGNIALNTSINLTGGVGAADVSFNAATITSSGAFTINTNGRNLNIVANSLNIPDLTLRSFTTNLSGNIQITANSGDMVVGNVQTATTMAFFGNAGSINLNAFQGNIITKIVLAGGSLVTGLYSGGNINLNAPNGSITVDGGLRSRGRGAGNTSGSVNINAGNLFRVTGFPSAACPVGSATICSSGINGAGNGAITIRHGGGITSPFLVGNSAINGSESIISAGVGSTIDATTIISVPTYTQGLVQILTTIPPAPPPVPTVSPQILSLLQTLAPPPAPAPVIMGTPPEPTPAMEPPLESTLEPTLESLASIPLAESFISNSIVNPVIDLIIDPRVNSIAGSVSSPNILASPGVIPDITNVTSTTNTVASSINPTTTSSVTSNINPTTTSAETSILFPSIALSAPSNLPPTLQTVLAGGAVNPPISLENTVNPPISLENSETSLPLLMSSGVITNPTSTEVSARLGGLENSFQADFEQYLGRSPQTYRETQANSESSNQEFTLDGLNQQANNQYSFSEIQEKLNQITETSRVKPALIYVFFAPPNSTNNFNSANLAAQTTRAAQDNDSLEVILINGQGQPVRVQFPHTTRRQVLEVANEFRSEVTNFRNSRGYLQPAKQMYDWILKALEQELQKQEINNLVFLMDTGLRSIPLAAMHDGNGFVIERYSVGLMPSLNLTETNYNSLEGSQVLAMGATTFTDSGLDPLPAVSLEINTVSQLWQGLEFLNDHFTLLNLIQQRQNRPFRMIHLATHAVFSPGDRANSYIQLWDRKLSLDQLSQLNWGNPPVDLLVLSACQTALGDRDAELGFASLAISAGVRSALASLWEVNDAATLGLMTKFYQQLRVTTTKAEALQQAQLAMLRGEVRLENGNLVTANGNIPLTAELRDLGDLPLNHPYYWSAFTMVGNPW